MLIAFNTATMVVGLLALGSPLSGMPPRSTFQDRPSYSDSTQQPVTIRVSQESAPGVGDFDVHILGSIRALQSSGNAADFYMLNKSGLNYGNTEPALTANTSHIFFVNAFDGLALFVIHNNSNHPENGNGGSATIKFTLEGGKANLLLSDDQDEAVMSDSGTVFTGIMSWVQTNTDGMVVGPLRTGFTLLGEFILPPIGLGGGWEAISDDGSKISLSLVPGQRVRFDVDP